ncbi:MAG: DUF3592 domain-containing protein [Anaerolineae bacterium]|nr:DUF3592 domain-containing protein [Anaerolineae bacterium]
MIVCPWCGTHYETFTTNCKNCGGALPLDGVVEPERVESADRVPVPPPAPRAVPRNYVWRILLADGWSIAAIVFLAVGIPFFIVGLVLTVAVVTALVGIPFVGIGGLFTAAGVGVLGWRYSEAQQTTDVLKDGDATPGIIESVAENFHVQVNGRYPWTITYRYEVAGQPYVGRVTTLSQPDLSQHPGRRAYVLYRRENPQRSAIYPHPYGYYELH